MSSVPDLCLMAHAPRKNVAYQVVAAHAKMGRID